MRAFINAWRTSGPITRTQLVCVAIVATVGAIYTVGGIVFAVFFLPAVILALLGVGALALALSMFRISMRGPTEY